eukprot:10915149-Prorocentrum_lima.AAC.1
MITVFTPMTPLQYIFSNTGTVFNVNIDLASALSRRSRRIYAYDLQAQAPPVSPRLRESCHQP